MDMIYTSHTNFLQKKFGIDFFPLYSADITMTWQASLWWVKYKQDGRLALAYFSQKYKYFDQHLPTVKNKTTV